MTMRMVDLFSDVKRAWGTVGFIDDFDSFDLTRWTKRTTDSGTILADADGLNGVVELLPSDGSVADNDEAYLYTNEISKFLDGKPILIGARIQFAEAATNAANIMVGIGEGFGAADTLLDNGGGPPADYDGACFFKVDGGTRWNFESSLGTTQQTTELDYTAGGSSYQSLIIEIIPISSSEAWAIPWIDAAGGNAFVEAMPYSTSNPRPIPVKHRFAYSSPGEMAFCIGVKNGSANQQPLNVDLAILQQVR